MSINSTMKTGDKVTYSQKRKKMKWLIMRLMK